MDNINETPPRASVAGRSGNLSETGHSQDTAEAQKKQAIRYLIHRFGVQMFAPKGGVS